MPDERYDAQISGTCTPADTQRLVEFMLAERDASDVGGVAAGELSRSMVFANTAGSAELAHEVHH